MFDINMYDLSDLPNKVTYCNWSTGMVRYGIIFWGLTEFKFVIFNYVLVILLSFSYYVR